MSQTPGYVDHRKPRSFDPQQAAELRRRITERVKMEFASTVEEASPDQIYEAVGLCVRDDIMDRWIDGRAASQNNGMKCVIYLSAEFLIGRALTNNMVNLGTYDDYAAALASMGLNLARIEEHEADAGLGNGGLGRLAACFLDSLSTLDYPAMGCGIRYEYGFFRQRIHEGAQIEVPDDWGASGDIWEIERPSRAFEVRFGGDVVEHWDETGRLSVEHRNYKSVYAVPYDMPIVGYDTALPATLRLWSARAPHRLDLVRFNSGDYVNATAERELAESISKVLYPEDNHEQGRKLRLRQFYFLVSATMQSIVSSHKRRHGDLHTLPEKICVQIEQTPTRPWPSPSSSACSSTRRALAGRRPWTSRSVPLATPTTPSCPKPWSAGTPRSCASSCPASTASWRPSTRGSATGCGRPTPATCRSSRAWPSSTAARCAWPTSACSRAAT